jgi:hypothetical protein
MTDFQKTSPRSVTSSNAAARRRAAMRNARRIRNPRHPKSTGTPVPGGSPIGCRRMQATGPRSPPTEGHLDAHELVHRTAVQARPAAR